MYTEVVGDTQLIEVNVNVDPTNSIKLREGLLNCEFSPLIGLEFKNIPGVSSSNININMESQLSFSGFNYVSLKDASLNFTNPEAANGT